MPEPLASPEDLKTYTLYRCPKGDGAGHSSVWTGAMSTPRSPEHDTDPLSSWPEGSP